MTEATKAPKLTVIAMDTETTGRAPEPHFPATPMYDDNRMLCAGFLRDGKATVISGGATTNSTVSGPLVKILMPTSDQHYLYVGHNIGFDLQVLAKAMAGNESGGLGVSFWFGFGDNIQVWDTMVAHYIINGQDTDGMSLEDVAAAWGVSYTKNPAVVEAIKAGQLEALYKSDPKLVEEYMLGDVQAAYDVAMKQMEHVNKAAEQGPNQYPLMAAMQDMVLVKAEMEQNGVPFSIGAAAKEAALVGPRIEVAYVEIRREITKLSVSYGMHRIGNRVSAWAGRDDMSVTDEELVSPSFLKRLFYKTEYELETRVPKTFKNGTTKMVRGTTVVASQPIVPTLYSSEKAWPKTPGGEPSLDAKALKLIAARVPVAAPLIAAIEELRGLEKLLGTYFESIPRFALNHSIGPIPLAIHTAYNLTVTKTGRLSSSSPNLQNPPPEAKRMFVAPKGWKFLEIDYQQLEVVGLAILSGDKQLQDDIRNGRDIHTVLFEAMYGKVPTDDERKAFKPLTFGLIYGAGDRTLSENSGKDLPTVKKFRRTFFDRYPDVQRWYDKVSVDVSKMRMPSSEKSAFGVPIGKAKFPLLTGRVLTFKEQEVPWSPRDVSFTPSDLANWPVQSFATGDVVPTMLGVLARRLWNGGYRREALLIGTTHDSVLLLVHEKLVEQIWNFCYNILSNTSDTIGKYYSMKIDVPLLVSGAMGDTWADCSLKANKLSPPTTSI